MTAQVVNSDDYEDLWGEVTTKFGNYGQYQNRTDRVIPLVVVF